MKESPYHPGSGIPAGNQNKHPNQDPASKGPHHPKPPKPKAPTLPGPRRDMPKGGRR